MGIRRQPHPSRARTVLAVWRWLPARLLLSCVLGLSAGWTAMPAAAAVLRLAADGKTPYSIIVRATATEAEHLAARELALFLGQMTGAQFPVKTDTSAPAAREIVLGPTNRFDPANLPPALRPQVPEGFTILPRGQRLLILGSIPRATLYGVYDLLEMELGCRFLAPHVNYVPQHPDLSLKIRPRKYDPPLEYRNLHIAESEWAVRNRLNASWDGIPLERQLGGVRFVGPSFVHTAGYLVPAETYYEAHPEYYALVDGQRHQTVGGRKGQLCLSHPEVFRIACETARGWISAYKSSPLYNPYSQLIVSVSANDNGLVCECPACAAINAEEATPGGTLFRFVNAVAAALATDHPGVRVETLAYGPSLRPPAVTRLRDNVIIRFAPIEADFGRTLDDPVSELNRPIRDSLESWSGKAACIYVWHYVVNFHSYLKPFPNLRVLPHDVRFLRDHGMRGLYAQGSQTAGSELRPIRDYLLAKLLWRPETDAREVIEEFCRLYYGRAAPSVLQYVDLLHDYYEQQDRPLRWNDASRADGVVYDDDFVQQADDILAQGEMLAQTAAQKHRVAVARMPFWYMVVMKALGELSRGGATTLAPGDLQVAARRLLEVSQAEGVTHLSEFYGPPGEQLEKELYPKLRLLLTRGTAPAEAPAEGTIRVLAAFLGNEHRTFTVALGADYPEGAGVFQTADRDWTLGQAIRWDITPFLRAAQQAGQPYQLRVRARVDRMGDKGAAFRFGYFRINANYSADICAALTVNAAETPPGQWQWFTLPDPVEFRASDRGQQAFVLAANNPQNVRRVAVDVFELVPLAAD